MAKKILVVDDDAEVTSMVEIALKTNGYDCIVSNDSKDVVARSRREKPHLIILDIMMPDMDGTDLNIALKENWATKDIPVIFLTGLIKKSEEQKDTNRKDVILAKPFSVYELLTKIRELIGD